MIDTDEAWEEEQMSNLGCESVSDLIAEVKRLERELDTQYEYIEWLEEFAPKAEDYNTVWDAYELAKGIHWTQVEEEE
jgi:phage shock protein A|tara:strand:+ start:3209 stop:3442 length:234 start_codon:yes stop_codon:yes gene_type:complete